jgi:hypothetical protein
MVSSERNLNITPLEEAELMPFHCITQAQLDCDPIGSGQGDSPYLKQL